MCICVFKPKDVVLTKKLLHKCYDNNADSWGFAYPDDKGKQIIVERNVSGFRDFWRHYRQVPTCKPSLIHFRIATSGQVDVANAHPWLIDKKHALIHNGNIESKLDVILDENMSDTGVFVETKLKPLFKDKKLKKGRFWKTDAFKWLMEEAIGKNNKMVILDADGEYIIYHENQGEWEHDVWFSNKTYKEDRKNNRAKVETVVEHGWASDRVTFANGRTVYQNYRKVEDNKDFVLLPNKTNNMNEVDIGELI